MRIIPYFLKEFFIPNEINIIKKVFSQTKTINPTMIDVGACVGDSFLPFFQKGWNIHAFEPNLDNFNFLNEKFSDKKINIHNTAVSNKKQKMKFYIDPSSKGIGSLTGFTDKHEFSHEVDVITLKDYCFRKKIKKIDFLKIDAEGYDKFVLDGFDWYRFLPKIILCEFENKKTIKLNYTTSDLIKLFFDKNYRIIVSEWFPIIHYGNAHKWKSFRLNNFQKIDKNSWGNIIAIQDEDFFNIFTKLAKTYENFWSLNLYHHYRKHIL